MSDSMIFANLLHLSYNMWGDWENPAVKSPYWTARPYLRFDEKLWNELLETMRKHGMSSPRIPRSRSRTPGRTRSFAAS
jgi:hypothetical protein